MNKMKKININNRNFENRFSDKLIYVNNKLYIYHSMHIIVDKSCG